MSLRTHPRRWRRGGHAPGLLRHTRGFARLEPAPSCWTRDARAPPIRPGPAAAAHCLIGPSARAAKPAVPTAPGQRAAPLLRAVATRARRRRTSHRRQRSLLLGEGTQMLPWPRACSERRTRAVELVGPLGGGGGVGWEGGGGGRCCCRGNRHVY